MPKGIALSPTYSDSQSLVQALHQAVNALQDGAYLEASLDSLSRRDSLWQAFLHVGPLFRWASLSVDGIPPEVLRGTGFRESAFPRSTVEPRQLRRWQDKLLESSLNRGYPFARIGLDDLEGAPDQLTARLHYEPGPFILLDTLQVEGAIRLNRHFLENYLGLKPGDPYDQSRVLRIRERLRELNFLQLRADPTVDFLLDRALITLPLENRRASRFDFLIGILPNSTQVNRLLITGSLEGELFNQLGWGERTYLRFEQLRPETQRLDVQFNYPYTAGLPVGADLRFHLYKRDTTFLDVDSDLGIQYALQGNDYFKVYWNNRASRILGINEAQLLQSRRLPASLDVRTATFGLEFFRQRLDYRFNPRSGWMTRLRAGAGTKRTLRNRRIEGLELGYLYDSLELRASQYRLEAHSAVYVPLWKRSTLQLAGAAQLLLSDQPIYRNEQFRIGGNRLLRGFDEEFFLVTHYAVGTLEYRLLLGQNSYLYAFFDNGWLENSTVDGVEVFYPYGWGAGITFETKAGIFGISLAYGTRWGTPLDLNSPKVHFGYVSLF